MEQQLMIRRWIRQSVICRLHSCQATTELTHWSFLYELWFWLARSTSLQSKKIVIHLVNKQHLPKRMHRWGPCFNWGWEAAPKKNKNMLDRGNREPRDGRGTEDKSQRVEASWYRRSGWMIFHFRVITILISGDSLTVTWAAFHLLSRRFSKCQLDKDRSHCKKTTFWGLQRTRPLCHGWVLSAAAWVWSQPGLCTACHPLYRHLFLAVFDYQTKQVSLVLHSYITHMISGNPEEHITDSC